MLESQKRIVACFVLFIPICMALLMFARVASIPSEFLLIEFGRFTGPILGLVFVAAIPIIFLLLAGRVLSRFENSMTKAQFRETIKRNKTKIAGLFLISFSLSFLLYVPFSIAFVASSQQEGVKVAQFVSQNTNETLPDYVSNLTVFLNSNLKPCYGKIESMFKIDEQVSTDFLDSWVLNVSGVTRADVILFQGWGACGQAAILLEQVIHDSGYVTRLAHFKGIDHEWVEVRNGSSWLIVDPWYIGNLVSIQNLRNAKPDFARATGVEIQVYNSTAWIDDSKAHGY